jgi:hypothetical protein
VIHFFPNLELYNTSLTTSSTYDILIPNFIGPTPSLIENVFFKKGTFNEMHLQNEIFPLKEWTRFDQLSSGQYVKNGRKVFRVDINLVQAAAGDDIPKGITSSIEISGYTASSLVNKFMYGPGIADFSFVIGTSSENSVIINRATYRSIPSGSILYFSDSDSVGIASEPSGPTQSYTVGPITYTFYQDFTIPNFKKVNTTEPTIFWSPPESEAFNGYLGKRNVDETVFKANFNNDGTPLDQEPPGLEAGSFESSLDKILLLRSSVEGGINNFETIAIFDAQQFNNTRYFYDYLIEPGILYRYKLQGVRPDKVRGQTTALVDQPNIIPDFTGSFLYGKDDIQINFIYNGAIDSFQEVKRDSLLETIGGKYPYIIRNSSIGYKQFSFSAFITHVSDPTRALGGLTYSELLSRARTKDNFIDERYEDYLRTGSQLFTVADPSNFASINRFTPNNQPTNIDRSNNFIVEKEFRKKLMAWLYDGNPKVFKSDTEGIFLVKLTEISFTPIVETGRIIYSFSCTMTEVGPADISSLIKFGVRKEIYTEQDLYIISNIENFVVQWQKETLFPNGQYFVFEGRYYKAVEGGLTETAGPTGTDELTVYGGVNRMKYVFVGYSIPGRF